MCKRLFLLGVLLTLVACASQKDPIWLDAGKVRMTSYTDSSILVLPVETSPSYRLSKGQEREIQQQIHAIVEDVFRLNDVNSPENIHRFDSYPYTLEEVQRLLRTYRTDAAFVISVFDYHRKDDFSPDTLGIRLAFIDASDPDKAWATTREYVSNTQELIGSPSLEYRVKTDMQSVERALRSGNGFSGFVGTVLTFGLWRPPPSDGPRLAVTTESRGSTQIGRQLGGTIDTKQSTYSIVVTAEDENGVESLNISNLSRRENEFFESTRMKDGNFPNFNVMSVDLELRPGKNKIEIESTNGLGKRSVRRLVLNRIENQEIFVLGVGISDYGDQKSYPPVNEQLNKQFNDAKDNVEGEFFLLQNQNATFREIMRRLDAVTTRTAQNEDSIGVFYFSGHLLAAEDELFLAAYDSEAAYAEFTSVPLPFLDKRMRERGVIILDLCEDDPEKQFGLQQVLPYALVSFDSCGMEDLELASRIDELTDSGMSIRTAINTVFDERAQQQRYKF